MKIHTLDCGCIRIPGWTAESGGRFSTEIGRAALVPDSRRITLPVHAFLIEQPKGLFLVDTGWSREISPAGVYDRNAVLKVLPKHLAALYRPYVAEGMTVAEQLSAKGIKPEDLEAVMVTHFDADHVCGLRSVRGARRVILHEEERYWSARTKYRMRQARELWEFEGAEHPFFKGCMLGPMHRAVDVTGDESIMIFNLPGHTDGHAGVMVRGGRRYAVIAGDAALSPGNWEKTVPAGLCAQAELQKKSLKWLAETAEDPDCVGILCSHDPSVPLELEL